MRSKLGFLVRQLPSVQVDVEDGLVTLRGPVLADEFEQLVSGVRAVRGVDDVDNQLGGA
ncbi:MAG: BON domain-containing protein [Candidatus Binatia bacterium]